MALLLLLVSPPALVHPFITAAETLSFPIFFLLFLTVTFLSFLLEMPRRRRSCHFGQLFHAHSLLHLSLSLSLTSSWPTPAPAASTEAEVDDDAYYPPKNSAEFACWRGSKRRNLYGYVHPCMLLGGFAVTAATEVFHRLAVPSVCLFVWMDGWMDGLLSVHNCHNQHNYPTHRRKSTTVDGGYGCMICRCCIGCWPCSPVSD